jgi:hypothetical protein
MATSSELKSAITKFFRRTLVPTRRHNTHCSDARLEQSQQHKTTSSSDLVFALPELMEQILNHVDTEDLFIFLRISKTFRHSILGTTHLRRRYKARLPDPRKRKEPTNTIYIMSPLLVASWDYLGFTFLVPLSLDRREIATRPGHLEPFIRLEYSYTLGSLNDVYWDGVPGRELGSLAMRRGDRYYKITPGWANVWLPNAVVYVRLRVYRYGGVYVDSKVMRLEAHRAEMLSLAMTLQGFVWQAEGEFSSRKVAEEQ